MRHKENHRYRHVPRYRTSGVWALVLALVLLGMADSTRAQPVDIPATWGGDVWSRPRLTGSWGGLRDDLGKKGVVLDIDLLQTLQGVASGGRNEVATYLGHGRVYPQRGYPEAGPLAGRVPARPGSEQLRPKHRQCLRGPPLA